MSRNISEVQKKLQSIRAQYLKDLPKKIEQLYSLWTSIKNGDNSTHKCQELERLTHSLAGSGTTFGCPDISKISHSITNICKSFSNFKDKHVHEISIELEPLLNELSLAGKRYIDHSDTNLELEPTQHTHTTTEDNPLIYIVDDDPTYADAIASTLEAANYSVNVYTTSDQLHMAVNHRKPAAIVMDMVLEEGIFAGAKTAENFAHHLKIPVIFLSIRSDFNARLAAVRAGALAYFSKPVDTGSLISTLDRLTSKVIAKAFRVLIIDDDKPLSETYAQYLSLSGIDSKILNTPIGAIDEITRYDPELILLDIDMPEINGLELGAIIRQFDEYRHIPIVYLTADNAIQTRIATMHLGADDFLSKPISPELLAHAIEARLYRARSMRNGELNLQKSLLNLEFLKSALDEHAIVSITDLDGRITYINKKFIEISGYSSDELIGKNHNLLKSGDHSKEFYEEMWHKISSGRVWHGTIKNRAKDGHFYDVHSTIVPKLDEAGLPEQYISIRTDVSALKELERKVEKEAEQLSQALSATDSGIWEWNNKTGEVFYDSNWLKLLHYPKDKSNISLTTLIHPSDLPKALHTLLDYLETPTENYHIEYRILNGTGQWDWVSDTGKVVEFDNNNFPSRIIGTTKLINQRKLLETQKQQIQSQLIQAQKMESIGHLTAGIAHDFNNLLGGILGYNELCNEVVDKNGEPEKLKKYITEINTAGVRAKELVAQMLLFSRLSPEQDSENDEIVPTTLLKPILKEVVHLLRSSIPTSIQINYQIQDDSLKARIQPVHLHQILLNLSINARDAIKDYGKITISLSKSELSDWCNSCHSEFAGEYAVITITDTGSGIPDHLENKIFEPFFTTKDIGKGTGMGLSVVHGVVHGLGGHIKVTSTDKNGTSIRVLLPLPMDADIESIESPDNNQDKEINSLSNTNIMVVDDEVTISTMLYELLTMHGANVTTYNSSLQALAAFAENPGKTDIVVTDETMPKLSGIDLSRKIFEIRSNIPIILCTGYSNTVNEEVALQAGIRAFMNKPIEFPRLIQSIKEQL